MSDGTVVNQKALAKILGVTPRQVHNLTEDGRVKSRPASNGRDREYVLEEVVPAYVAFKVESVRASSRDDRSEAARLRKLEAEATRAELEVQETRGELMRVEVHTTRMGALLDRLSARLSAAPGAWAPRLVGVKTVPEALARGRELVNELLEAMKAAADEIIPAEEPSAGDQAA